MVILSSEHIFSCRLVATKDAFKHLEDVRAIRISTSRMEARKTVTTGIRVLALCVDYVIGSDAGLQSSHVK